VFEAHIILIPALVEGRSQAAVDTCSRESGESTPGFRTHVSLRTSIEKLALGCPVEDFFQIFYRKGRPLEAQGSLKSSQRGPTVKGKEKVVQWRPRLSRRNRMAPQSQREFKEGHIHKNSRSTAPAAAMLCSKCIVISDDRCNNTWQQKIVSDACSLCFWYINYGQGHKYETGAAGRPKTYLSLNVSILVYIYTKVCARCSSRLGF
jgi:hypothetical protein